MHGKAVRSKSEARSIDDLWANIRRLRECPAYTLLYQFSPKDTDQSKVK